MLAASSSVLTQFRDPSSETPIVEQERAEGDDLENDKSPLSGCLPKEPRTYSNGETRQQQKDAIFHIISKSSFGSSANAGALAEARQRR